MKEDQLSADFDQRILSIIGEEETPHVKARIISLQTRLKPLYKAAACVAVILSLGLAAQMPYRQAELQDAQQFAESHKKDSVTISTVNSVAMNDSTKVDSTKTSTLVR